MLQMQMQRGSEKRIQAAASSSADSHEAEVFSGPFVASDGGDDGAGPSSPAQNILAAAEQQQTPQRKGRGMGRVVRRLGGPCCNCSCKGELTTS